MQRPGLEVLTQRMEKSQRDQKRTGPEASDRNIGKIAELERAALHDRSAGDRLSDGINRWTGSMPFAIVHVFLFMAWILVNTGQLPAVTPFDPFPFNFLTLVVSLEAIFLSLFVLMSQNRIVRQADKRAHLDLQVDLLAEQELTALLHMLRAVCAKLEVEVSIPDEHVDEMLNETDVHKLASALDDRLPQE